MEGKGAGFVIVESKKYARAFKKLPREIQKQAWIKIELFRQYPTHAGLHVHKLCGEHVDEWAFRVNYEYRIIFFKIDDTIIFSNIGKHAVYQ